MDRSLLAARSLRLVDLPPRSKELLSGSDESGEHQDAGTEGVGDGLDRTPLLVRDVIGNRQADPDEEVARPLVRTDPTTSDPERAPVRGAGRYPNPDGRPPEGRHLDLRAQDGLGPADRCLYGQVEAAAPEYAGGEPRAPGRRDHPAAHR